MDLGSVRALFLYRSFAAFPGISHRGLGISSTNNMLVLRQNGIDAIVRGLPSEDKLRQTMDNNAGVTHVVSSAPWIRTTPLAYIVDQFPEVSFAVNCHSNWGFLQVESGAIKLIREEIDLEAYRHNFHVAGNSKPYCDALTGVYNAPCTYLPNMYYLNDTVKDAKRRWADNGGRWRIGLFGAPRKQKNMESGLVGILQAANEAGVMVEVVVNAGRNDNGEATNLLQAFRETVRGLPYASLLEYQWAEWPDFRRMVATCDALVNVSTSETFNIVAADGASQSIPSVVVADAIRWAPPEWGARADDPGDIARKLLAILHDPGAGRRGLEALAAHNQESLGYWVRYLTENRFGTGSRIWTTIGAPEGGAGHRSMPGVRRFAA